MGGFSNLGSVYVEVGADLSALTKDLQGALAEASKAGQEIGTSIEQGIGNTAPHAAEGLHEVAGAADEAHSSFGALGESAGELAGLFGIGLGIEAAVEGLKSLAESSIEAYGEIQLATVALTALTGSAELATEVIEKMKALAMSSIFPDTQLISAAQKMAAIGVATESIAPAMQAVVAAAEGTGNSLDAVSSALDRIYLSGTVSSRTLSQLGISLNDLAETTGIAADQVKDSFQALGPESDAALEILRATVERKMAGVGDAVKGTLPNAINQVKVQWNDLLETLGGGAAGGLTEFLKQINETIATFRVFGEAIKSIGGAGGILESMFPQVQMVGQAWSWFREQILLATAAIDTVKGKYSDFGTAVAELHKQTDAATTSTKGLTQATKDGSDADADAKEKLDAANQAAKDALAADQNRKALKDALTQATAAANEAEKTLAEDMRALSIPAVKDLATAENDVVTARTALVTADGIEQSALAALNAEREKAVPNATTLKQLEQDLKTASEGAAIARTSLKDAESALDLTRKTAKDAAAEIQKDEEAHANFLKATAVPVVMSYQTALDLVNTAKRNAAEADAALTVAETQYNAALKSGDPATIAASTLKLQDARAKLKTSTDAIKTSEDNLKKSQDAVNAATKEIQTIDKALDDFYLREMTPHLSDLKTAINDTADAKKAAIDASDNLRRIELDLESAILNEGDATEHVTELRAQAAAALQDFTNKSKDFHDIEQKVAADLGITTDQLKLLVDQQDKTKTSADILADAYEADGIKTKTQLEAVREAAIDAYNAIIKDPSAGLQQRLDALQKATDAQIAMGQAIPADQQIQLAKMEQQEKDYIDGSAKRWTNLSNQIHDDVQGMFSGIFTDLFNGGDVLQTIENTFKKIGEQMVEAIFKPITDLISQTIAGLLTPLAKTLAGWIQDALVALFPSLAGVFGSTTAAAATAANTTAITANTAAVSALTSALGGESVAGAASGAGGSGGAGGAAAAGITGWIGAISSAVSAVTGVLQLFGVGQGGEKDRLNIIANNTSFLAWVFDAGGLRTTIMDIQNRMQILLDAFGGWNRDFQNDLKDQFTDLLNHIRSIDLTTQHILETTAVTAVSTASMQLNIKGTVQLDGKELFASWIKWAEDNGLVVPQSS